MGEVKIKSIDIVNVKFGNNVTIVNLVHLYGQPVEIDKIIDIAKANNLYVI